MGNVRRDAVLVIGEASLLFEDAHSLSLATSVKMAATAGAWFVVAVMAFTGCVAPHQLFAVEVMLSVVQTQAATNPPPNVWLLGAAAQAGTWGLGRAARIEAPSPLQCFDGMVSALLARRPTLSEPEAVLRPAIALVPRLKRKPRAAREGSALAADAQLVTGGTSGLGLLTARWIVQRGVNSLTLASRSGLLARDAASEWKCMLRTSMVTLVQRCDTSEGAHVARLMACVGRASGVWHAAGVLADGVLPRQTAEALAHVIAPKARGACAFQCACAAAVLRTCALFSSVVALLGGAGQANYAAANACLDATASCCRAHARAATSVQWGAWAEVGMAARGVASERMAAMEAASGFGRLGLAQGLGALHAAVLPSASSLVGVVLIQWQRMLGGGGAVPAFLTSMVSTAHVQLASAVVDRRVACGVSLDAVLEMVRRTAGGAVDADAPLMEAGVDSLGAVELRNQLQRAVGEGMLLSSTLVFDHPTARQVSLHLQGARRDHVTFKRGSGSEASSSADVEIVGLSIVLPEGSSSAMSLRVLSRCSCNLLRVIPLSRWDVEQAAHDLGGTPPEVASRVRHGGFLYDAELFEHGFFSVSAAEAAAMDPQQRQLLERGYKALHAAGHSKASLLGAVVAVNVGQWASEFVTVLLGTPAGRSVYASTGFACSVTCGRVSFTLGLQGPCASYDTACCASLVANHGSVRALQRSECDAALSAGVNMILDPAAMRGNAVGGFTSVRGRSHTFDMRADGYARGEAIDAMACRLGEQTMPRVLGSAVRQDGRSASLTAPNGQAQQGVLGASLADARLMADEVALLEAHGTGTALGDPIEAGALSVVLLAHRAANPLVVGSLKANAGHTEPGAGLAGALKLLTQLQGETTSPNAQLRALNPHVAGALHDVICALAVQLAVLRGGPRVGGVSSFGYSGTIAHAVLRHAGGDGRGAALLPPLVNHRHALLWRDPTHPFVQRASYHMDVAINFRSPAEGALHALVADHVVQGRVIFPGAGYLEVARAAATGSALRGVFFLQPFAVEAAGMLVECTVADGRFEVRCGVDDTLADSAVHCSGALAASSGRQCIDHACMRAHSCYHASCAGALYDGFDAVRLQYGPGYRTLTQAWGGTSDAVARLRARATREGAAVHPADLDDALCTGAAIDSSGGGETRLPFAVDDARLQEAPGALWAVCCMRSSPRMREALHKLTCGHVLAGCVASERGGHVGAAGCSGITGADAARRLQVTRFAGGSTIAAPSVRD